MTKNDDLWADVVGAVPRLKDPEQIRIQFELLRPLDRFEYRAHRNFQDARKAAVIEGKEAPEPRIKIKRDTTTFTSVADSDNIPQQVQWIQSYLGTVQYEGRRLRGIFNGNQDHATRVLKQHNLFKEA